MKQKKLSNVQRKKEWWQKQEVSEYRAMIDDIHEDEYKHIVFTRLLLTKLVDDVESLKKEIKSIRKEMK
jgi:hypothetical protein